MSPEQPIALRVLLGFLKAGRVLDGGSSALLLGTVVLASAPGEPLTTFVLAVALALGLVEKYLAWRVALDVEFFTLLYEQPEKAAAFDAALADFLNQKSAPAPRSMASRWQGARRLVRRQAVLLVVQAGLVLLVLVGRFH
ncbi:hypothetical protein IC235_17265 [Hymenobacter sp. BT664]|uniref:Uncharacterized protein n=1 Tax=Hymenobacter montanus TaxID=2771359 RepID=A0A927BF06_9BACT|nr:hypothetical protein [Hymenobacter montanus]MBD2769642.1 hypothetical protein [Hymenobacter montanus]